MKRKNPLAGNIIRTLTIRNAAIFYLYSFGTIFHVFPPRSFSDGLIMASTLIALTLLYYLMDKRISAKMEAEDYLLYHLPVNFIIVATGYVIVNITPIGSPLSYLGLFLVLWKFLLLLILSMYNDFGKPIVTSILSVLALDWIREKQKRKNDTPQKGHHDIES